MGCLSQTILSFIKNWCITNPGYEITILTLDNYKHYVKGLDVESLPNIEFPARISDIIRIHALAQHGGIWADASMLFTSNLDWILQLQQKGGYEFIGYYIGKETVIPTSPVIENWSFACAPGSQLCEDWRAEFMRLQSFPNATAYVNSVLSEGIVPGCCQGIIGSPKYVPCLAYLTQHLAADGKQIKILSISLDGLCDTSVWPLLLSVSGDILVNLVDLILFQH